MKIIQVIVYDIKRNKVGRPEQTIKDIYEFMPGYTKAGKFDGTTQWVMSRAMNEVQRGGKFEANRKEEL